MSIIIVLLKGISGLSLIGVVIFLISLVWRAIRWFKYGPAPDYPPEKGPKKFGGIIFMILFHVVGIVYFIGSFFAEHDRIGSLYEDQTYSAQYFIKVESGSKTLRLRADLERDAGKYYIDAVRWTDGKKYPASTGSIRPGKEFEIEIDFGDGNEYYDAVLTDEKVW